MHALILAFDRLNTNLLGCYGNQQIATPSLDRLASESVVFDQHFGENFDATAAGHAWWHGLYTFPRSLDQQRNSSQFLSALREAGVVTCLVRDTAAKAADSVADQFCHIDETTLCHEATETGLEDVAARISEHWDRITANRQERSLVWVSLPGLPECPLQGGSSHTESALEIPIDTDAFLAEVSTYLAPVDRLVGQILDQISKRQVAEQLLLIVTAASGIALPHMNLFHSRSIHLTECLVHAPLIVRFPSRDRLPCRRRTLVQTIDIAPSLFDWYGIDPSTMPIEGQSWLSAVENSAWKKRKYLCMGIGTRECAIRTTDFHLVQTDPLSSSGKRSSYVFLKPEDIWDVHDVADQSPEIVEQLGETLQRFMVNAQSTCPASFPPLP